MSNETKAPQPPAEAQGDGEASEGWHAALDSASELVSNAPDARYRKRAEQVRDWIKARPDTPPSAPVGVEGLVGNWQARAETERAESKNKEWAEWMRENHAGAASAFATCASQLEQALAQQPAAGVGEEIMVNAAHDVYTLPLQPSGLSSGPRFVVHVPAPEQPAAEYQRMQPCGCVLCVCEDEEQCHGCGAKHCGNRTDHPAYVEQQPAADGDMAELVGLLDEVRSHFTRDDDLPDDLLPRIDAALATQSGGSDNDR